MNGKYFRVCAVVTILTFTRAWLLNLLFQHARLRFHARWRLLLLFRFFPLPTSVARASLRWYITWKLQLSPTKFGSISCRVYGVIIETKIHQNKKLCFLPALPCYFSCAYAWDTCLRSRCCQIRGFRSHRRPVARSSSPSPRSNCSSAALELRSKSEQAHPREWISGSY